MRDYSVVMDNIEEVIKRMGGQPLSEIQRMAVAASIGVWTEKYVDEAVSASLLATLERVAEELGTLVERTNERV